MQGDLGAPRATSDTEERLRAECHRTLGLGVSRRPIRKRERKAIALGLALRGHHTLDFTKHFTLKLVLLTSEQRVTVGLSPEVQAPPRPGSEWLCVTGAWARNSQWWLTSQQPRRWEGRRPPVSQ